MQVFRKPATWVAEKIADVLLGGDVLAPDREGTEIDWDDVTIEKPRRSVTAGIPRIQLELAIGAANRRLDGQMDEEACRAMTKRAPEIGVEETFAVKMGDGCSLTIEGRDERLLWLELNGSGVMFDVF